MIAALALAALVSSPIPTTGPAPQPPGFVAFCSRTPDQCRPTPGGAGRVTLTRGAMLVLAAVTETENRAIRPMDDLSHYGKAEVWAIPTDGLGDCEDYALAKRRDLAAAGFPLQALRLATVTTPSGEGHTVLTVWTDLGAFVLDNLNDDVRPWASAGYRWREVQDGEGGWGWLRVV